MVSCAAGPGRMMSRCLFCGGAPGGVFVTMARPSQGPVSRALPTSLHPAGGESSSCPGTGPCSGARNHPRSEPAQTHWIQLPCWSSSLLPEATLLQMYLATTSKMRSLFISQSLAQGKANGKCSWLRFARSGCGAKPGGMLSRCCSASASSWATSSAGRRPSSTAKPCRSSVSMVFSTSFLCSSSPGDVCLALVASTMNWDARLLRHGPCV
mmetsp:Transcript_15651/g.49281  ORF Transcript_15651/g.49281 Transcript_15651/m.49281 type:complete len:211 (+) Transcript_15651:171-803(+)